MKSRTGHTPRSTPLKMAQGQLSLVEHALCPLDPSASLTRNLVHSSRYHYFDTNRHQQTADVRVLCPLGLSANDELFLWGLLSLTLLQPGSEPELHASPHYCLRQLGQIDQHGRRGGRQYQLFAEALARLSAVVYQNDRFYDPVLGEHRRISFGFFSYSLPLDPQSSRAWRITWNPLFFEMVRAHAGSLRFELAVYRELDPASRRLFLLLTKIFQRRAASPRFELRHLAVDVLGFSATITTADLKKKVWRCIDRLQQLDVIATANVADAFEKVGAGRYRVLLRRGAYFERNPTVARVDLADSALWDSLVQIGLEGPTIRRLARQCPERLLREWADITLAARERFGERFFSRSPAAYFIDNIRHAQQNVRTAPDWWHELRKSEVLVQASQDRAQSAASRAAGAVPPQESAEPLDSVTTDLFQQFRAAGQPSELAGRNARRFAGDHAQRRVQSRRKSEQRVGSIVDAMFKSEALRK